MSKNTWEKEELWKLEQIVSTLRLIADGLQYNECSPEDAAGAVNFIAENIKKSFLEYR